MKTIISLLSLLASMTLFAEGIDTVALIKQKLDSLNSSFTYQQGDIVLHGGIGTLKVPEGFKYLDAEQTQHVLEDLWGNPDGAGTDGMLFPKDLGPISDNAWA